MSRNINFPITPYIVKRYACNTGSCPSPTHPSPLGGGYILPVRTFWQTYAQKVQLANIYAAGRRLQWVNVDVNAFASAASTPKGWGKPPANSF